MTYFNNITNQNELKAFFRKLCNELHPDKGGNSTEFIKMMKEYDSIKDNFNTNDEEVNLKAEHFYNILEQLNKLEDIEIQFIGSFIWLFDTKPNSMYQQKDLIKSFVFDGYNTARWANVKKSWYFSPKEYKRGGKKSYSINEIQSKYGVKSVQSQGLKKLA